MNHLTSQKTPSLHTEMSKKQGKIGSGQEDLNNDRRVPDFLPLGDLTLSQEDRSCMIPESFEKFYGNSNRTFSLNNDRASLSLREAQSYSSLFSTNANTSHHYHYDNGTGTSSRSRSTITTTPPPTSNISPRSVHMMIPRRSHCISDSIPFMPVL